MKKKYIIILIIFIVVMILFCYSIFTTILPDELDTLCDYNWCVVQDESEPDVFVFYGSGIVRIYSYGSDSFCLWSSNGINITITGSSHYNKTYSAEIYEQNDVTYLKLGNLTLEGNLQK